MTPYSGLKCWEIVNCDHADCLARSEPDTPCWQLAKRVRAFRDISHTCRDCIVYLIKNEEPAADKKRIVKILRDREDPVRSGTEHHTCILKASVQG